LYAPLAALNRGATVHPIYVGKAVPAGARKGTILESAATHTVALCNRLREHAESVAATALNIEDFSSRHLIVDDIWIPLAESLLIRLYRPVWNQVVDGFGNHDPGKGRHAGQRPSWDELHPGRAWALKCAPAKYSLHALEKMVAEHLRSPSAAPTAE
jgi:hypothetical protein